MNDDPLNRSLEKLRVPAGDEAAAARARHRAVTAFENREAFAEQKPAPWRWFAAGAAATACVLALLVAMWPHRDADTPPRNASTDRADAKLLAEMEALFPGQLDAVIASGGEISIKLAPERGATNSQRLAITLRRGASIVRVLGYSGRRVCLDLDGKRECFEPLLNAAGQVILAGENFVWSPERPSALDGYRVTAKALTVL
jgi:hypothetical protein